MSAAEPKICFALDRVDFAAFYLYLMADLYKPSLTCKYCMY